MTKRIFLLGAGSSKSHTDGLFPGIGEFFARAKKLQLTIDEEQPSEIRKGYEQLYDFVQEHFGCSIIHTDRAINIEEILTYVEIELQRNSSGPLVTVSEQLNDLIREVLLKLSDCVGDQNADSPSGGYKEFAERLGYRDTIITFNWDLLLDEVLKLCEQPYKQDREVGESGVGKQYANFLNRFTSNLKQRFDTSAPLIAEPYSEWRGDDGFYLKAHGSIDWYSCKNTSCRAAGMLFTKNEPQTDYSCAECGEAVMNVLVPPVLNKQLHAYPAIRSIWNTAAREIRATEELIIWGYSVPATDFFSKWLIRQARQKNLKSVTVINPSVLTGSKKNYAEYARGVHDMFSDLLTWESFRFYENFSDYLAGLEVRQKHPSSRLEVMRRKA